MAIRSHKMPKAYLKRFAAPPLRRKQFGKLWVYERGRDPRVGTAHSESAERGFFVSATDSGTSDDSPTEAWAERIEYLALDTLISAPSPLFVWTYENRLRMAHFWALMFLRSTSFFNFHKKGSEDLFGAQLRRLSTDEALRQRLVTHYALLFGRPFSEEEILGTIGRAVTGLLADQELRNQYVQHLRRRVDLISGIFLDKNWQIWTSPGDREFITCDSPVMTFRLDYWGQYFVGDGFGKEGSIIILPLSPTACLLAGITGPPSRHVSADDVKEINKIIVHSSARFIYSRTRDPEIDTVVQRSAGSIRYGISAFARNAAEDFDDLFF